nr:hypothetical protein [uncultured Blautia sp.]
MDDSFSALDFKTDARLRAALKNEVTESAVIMVAQRIKLSGFTFQLWKRVISGAVQ